jgi:hypothetical protein
LVMYQIHKKIKANNYEQWGISFTIKRLVY